MEVSNSLNQVCNENDKNYVGLIFLLLLSCMTTDRLDSKETASINQMTTNNLTSLDRLKRVPGIAIQQDEVLISGQVGQRSAAKGVTKPLFVIDGQRIGNGIEVVQGLVD